MIKIFSFEPELFNNNGDQGNIEVLQSVLVAEGMDVQNTQNLVECDFVLIGDCSLAVLDKFKDSLNALTSTLKDRLEKGLPTLIIGRPFELLASNLGIQLEIGTRVSKFIEAEFEGIRVWGYHNSEVESPKFFINGAFIGSTLFGPLLAKNPEVLELLLSELGVKPKSDFYRRGVELAEKARQSTTFE